jgi:hypothetical protein
MATVKLTPDTIISHVEGPKEWAAIPHHILRKR